MNGLKEEIKAEVKLYEPSTLVDLKLKAQMVEDKICVNFKGGSLTVARTTASYKPYAVTRSFSKEIGGSVGSASVNEGKGKNMETASFAGSTSGGQCSRGVLFRKLSETELR